MDAKDDGNRIKSVSKYTRFMKWIEMSPDDQLIICPFCSKNKDPELLLASSNHITASSEKHVRLLVYNTELEYPCVRGITYRFVPSPQPLYLLPNYDPNINPCTWESEVLFTSSRLVLQNSEPTQTLGRPSCKDCDSGLKVYVQLRRIRMMLNSHKTTVTRKERIKSVEHTTIRRMEIYERDQGLCHICKLAVDPNKFHIDHVVPISRGGTDTPENVRISHPDCNLQKYNHVDWG